MNTKNIENQIETQRIFITGDEWLYYKIYCGERTSDFILTDTLQPLIAELKANGSIDSWFFLRYSDPDFHLRIRFHLKDTHAIGTVITSIQGALDSFIKDDIVYKVQTDTYIRELERYGTGNIETSENLFHIESTFLLAAIDLIEDPTLYFLYILKTIDTLLDTFGYSVTEKLQLAGINQDAFKKEFNANKHLAKQLDKKYRGVSNELWEFLSPTNQNKEYDILYKMLIDKSNASAEDIKNAQQYLTDNPTEIGLNNLISSYIHMLVNRAFRSKQRFYELVCYDFLNRYYRRVLYAKK